MTFGDRARSSPRLWCLLAKLCCKLQPSVCARALASSKILAIIEKSLQENFGQSDADKIAHHLHGSVHGNGNIEAAGVHEAVVTTNSPARHSKKRKLVEDEKSNETMKKRKVLDNEKACTPAHSTSSPGDHQELFYALASCLRILSSMASDDTDPAGIHNTFALESIRSTLSVECVLAANLLGGWLTALLQSAENREADTESSTKDNDLLYDLAPIVRVWANRTIEKGDGADKSMVRHMLLVRSCEPGSHLLGVIFEQSIAACNGFLESCQAEQAR